MKSYYKSEFGEIYNGDSLEVLKQLPDESVNCCVTSPPYWGLRDYGNDNQLGLEKTPEEYVSKMMEIFREVKRVLRDDGTLWLNLGDSYHGGGSTTLNGQNTRNFEDKSTLQSRHSDGSCARLPKPRGYQGYKPKDLVGIPWRVAFALQSDGWYLRQDIIWSKPNPMPESVKDRCTKSHEYIFLLSKSQKYYYDHESIKHKTEGNIHDQHVRISKKRFPTDKISGIRKAGFYPMANKRSVWTVNTKPFKKAHFAVFPGELIESCILAGCPKDGIVLDPFFGSGTTGIVAYKHDRKFIGIELNKQYCDEIAIPRIENGTAQRKLF